MAAHKTPGKVGKRHSLRTALLKKMASPVKQPRTRRKSTQITPVKSISGVKRKSMLISEEEEPSDKGNAFVVGDIPAVERSGQDLSAVVLVPSFRASCDFSKRFLLKDKPAKADAKAEEFSETAAEDTPYVSPHYELGVLNDTTSQSEVSASPTSDQPSPRRVSMPNRSSRRVSKRQSDIGPMSMEKLPVDAPKRRSFGTGQSFDFNMSDLPTLDELKAEGAKFETTLSKLATTDLEIAAETEADPEPGFLEPEQAEADIEVAAFLFRMVEEEAKHGATDDSCKDVSDTVLANEASHKKQEQGIAENVTIMEDDSLPMAEEIMSTVDDEDHCIDFGNDQPMADESYLEEDELVGGSPTAPFDDDAIVPVGSPAYRANTAGSPPPELTALANAIDENFFGDEHEATQELTTDFASQDGVNQMETDMPTEFSRDVAPKRTRSRARFSDDTSILKEFLNRAHARKAAQALMPPPPPAQISPRRSPRKVLGNLDSNSPSPTKKRPLISERPGTPPMKKALPIEDNDDTLTLDLVAEPAPATRRSGRSRLPAPARTQTASVTSFIPVRRADGSEPVVLQRSQAQELASTTRTNTRKNKGLARMPKTMLETTLKDTSSSPIKKSPAKKAVRNRRKAVNWDKKLVYYQEELEAAASKAKKAVARQAKTVATSNSNGTPKVKKVTTATPDRSTSNGTPGPKRRGRSKV